MKRFLLGSLVGMLCTIGCVVLVWWYVQRSLFIPEIESGVATTTATPATAPSASETTTVAPEAAPATTTATTTPPAASGGVPVRELPLTTEQAELAASLGLDVEQMVISQALIECARETLGESRYQAILAGDTPGVLETARLVPCLGR